MENISIPLISPLSRKYYQYANDDSEKIHHRAEDVRICIEKVCDSIIIQLVKPDTKRKWKDYKLHNKIEACKEFMNHIIVDDLLNAKGIGNMGVHDGEEGNYSSQDIDKSLPVSVICDRGFMAIRSIRDNYECNIAYYTEKMKQKQMQDCLLENRFESAIKNKEFVAYFQPKYDVKTERITGAESLVRWINPDGSMVMPGDFIPLYEKDGLIVKLDEYIFRYVCEFQRELMKKGQELIPISVNLSRTSIHHSDIVERYMKIVEENGIPFSCVPVELTETATLNNVMIRDFTEKLVNAGFALHMDDFGSGYSSLITLSELPFNTLKIDKSLVDCIHQQKGRMVVQQVIILAHGLGMKVVAEGVETADQLELLKEMECDNIQGFYYSRPLPKAEFVKKSEEN